MSTKPDIVDVIRSLAAGSTVDWSALEAPADQSTRAILEELQIVSRVAQTHGTLEKERNHPDALQSGDARNPSAVSRTWGPLTLLEPVGHGAYGEVYRAWDPRLDREVALKLIPVGATDQSRGMAIQE